MSRRLTPKLRSSRGNRARLVVLAVLCGLTSSGCSRTAWNESDDSDPFDALETSTYTYDNGLTLVVHEDHRVPVVKVITRVAVGSADEPPGRGGFAHLFEHLMFTGTTAVPNFDQVLEGVGASNNAWTDFDETVYYETAPSAALNTLLWVDADRFANLGASITQADLDVQRSVVLNEMKQSVLDSPGGVAAESITASLFPTGHPYHRPVIGSEADLKAARLPDVVDFFTRRYRPDNLTVVIAGDVKARDVAATVGALHGLILRRSGPSPRSTWSREPLASRRCKPCRVRQTFRDAVTTPHVSITWRWSEGQLPWRRGPQTTSQLVSKAFRSDPEMELAAAMLSDPELSSLQRSLVRDLGVATTISAYPETRRGAQLFTLEAEANEGVTAAALELAMRTQLTSLLRDGFQPAEVSAAVSRFDTDTAAQLEQAFGRADLIREAISNGASPHDLSTYGKRFNRLRAGDVTTALRGVVATADSVTTTVSPDERGTTDELLTASTGKPTGALLAAPPEQKLRRPPDRTAGPVSVPAPRQLRLQSGIVLHHFDRPDAPLVHLELLVSGGGRRDPLGFEGRGELLAQMGTRGAGSNDAIEFAATLAELGSTIDVSGAADSYTVSVSSPPTSLDRTLHLLADVLQHPQMDPHELDLSRDELLAELDTQQQDPGARAFQAAVRLHFPLGSPVTRFPTESSLDAITIDGSNGIRAEYAAVFQPQNTVMVSGGPVSAEEITRSLDEALAGWKNGGTAIGRVDDTQGHKRDLQTVLVDVPGATQATVLLLADGPDPRPDAYLRSAASVQVLGGTFTSRLNRRLREELGITYGASAGLGSDRTSSVLQAGASFDADHVGVGVKELLRIVNEFPGSKITNAEHSSATASYQMLSLDLISTAAALVDTDLSMVALGRPWESLQRRLAAAPQLSVRDLEQGAAALRSNRTTLAIAGDLTEIKLQLAALTAAGALGTVTEEASAPPLTAHSKAAQPLTAQP